MHRTSDRFWKCFNNLPEPIQGIAKKNFDLLKSDPYHPSLHFKRTGNFWSARIGLNYRAIAVEDKKDFIWVWIGTHDDYEKMIK